MKRFTPAALVAIVALALLAPATALADASSSRDSVYLVGEFVDPVCLYQHGMQGVSQRTCAMVNGRVNQGIHFFDHRTHRVYTVIGMAHTDDPYATFTRYLGDTLAVTAKVWRRYGSEAIAITDFWPWRQQPQASFRWWPWSWHLSTVVGALALVAAYLLAITVWRRRLGGPERLPWGRAATFLGAIVVLLGSLNGPIHDLSDSYLFAAHMTQHLLLAEVFPLLLLLGIPPWLADALLRRAGARRAWYAASDYRVGFVAYASVLTLWHVPQFYDWMMRAHGVHIGMHLMLMFAATLMWWPFVGTATHARKLSPPAQLLYLLVLSTPMMVVSAFLTFAKQPFYEYYVLAPRVWANLSPLEDQKLGGLIMWVPGTFAYWLVMSAIFLRWSHQQDHSRADDDYVIPPMPATGGRGGVTP